MSVNSLANAAAARRPDTVPLGAVPAGLHEIAAAAAVSPAVAAAGGSAAGVGAGQAIDTTFNVLFGYIPTEVITLYVAALAALRPGPAVTPAEWMTFWVFLAATPIIVWLVYGGKLMAAKKPIPLSFGAWPVWEMLAATIAFSAWALAMPHSPFAIYDWYSQALAGVTVLVASTVLGLLAPFFQRPLRG